MIKFGMVGTGWRAEFFLRIAQACPDTFECVGIVGRSAAKTADLARRFSIKAYGSVGDMVAEGRPGYGVVSVNRGGTLTLLAQLAALNLPVLVETPPAESVEDLRQVWALVQNGANIQVAEQYWAQPHHAARLSFVHSGRLGRISQAQISVCHGYHGMSLMRRFLGITYETVTVSATSFVSPIVDGPGRNGMPAVEAISSSKQVIARFDFGDKLGIYDFTGDQYFSYIRGQHVLVRGDRGEMVDDHAVYLLDYKTPIKTSFVRHSAGVNGNLEGNFLKGIQVDGVWVYSNPLAPAALSDEEIAIGTCMLRMADCAAGGPSVYTFAEAAQDRYLDLLMEQALSSEQHVTSVAQPWHT